MFSLNRDIGKKYEAHAAKFLRNHGYRIVAKNFQWRGGEIDLVVINNSVIVFVEVKYRSNEDYGQAVETVTLEKQRKLIRTAHYFLQQHNEFSLMDARFDIIGMTPTSDDRGIEVDWIKGAFTT